MEKTEGPEKPQEKVIKQDNSKARDEDSDDERAKIKATAMPKVKKAIGKSMGTM